MDSLRQGREAFTADAWAGACTHLEDADRQTPLGLEDLERLAVATYLVGREVDSTRRWARGYHLARDGGDDARAARCAFWAAFVLLNRGDVPAGNGWITRAQRALDDAGQTVERGYVAYLEALRAIFGRDAAAARTGFSEAVEIGDRFRDADIGTLARLGLGRAFIRSGRPTEGIAHLDDAMVAVSGGEVSPIVVGDAYCTAIDGCREVFDLVRAREWTEGLSTWCDHHDDLVAFRGQCLIHRAEILQSRGAWWDALAEAQQAARRLSRPAGQLAIGAACYQEGELHRLRGEFDEAEAAYERARRRGREPLPGLALLRLAQGRSDAAAATIRRLLAETQSRLSRSRLLPAAVEVLLAVEDLEAARQVCGELEELAGDLDSRLLDATAAQAHGATRLAEGEASDSLGSLRRALDGWQQLDVPYEAARARVLIGQACEQLADHETAASEWAEARRVFETLGAATDRARVDRLARGPVGAAHGLTEREREVLRHVASGRTNRAIAEQLVISERTVDRHLSNIFTKLGVESRTAATAYAYEHDLI